MLITYYLLKQVQIDGGHHDGGHAIRLVEPAPEDHVHNLNMVNVGTDLVVNFSGACRQWGIPKVHQVGLIK